MSHAAHHGIEPGSLASRFGASTAPRAPVRAAVVGATGYAGQELVRLLARHPRVELTAATGSHSTSTGRRLPALSRIWDGEVRPLDIDLIVETSDLVFLALPERASAELAPALLAAGRRVVDLSGAFRLRDDRSRAEWYPATATLPAGTVYGLTEFSRDALRSATLVANPGCYPTAALLSLLPLSAAGILEETAEVIVDAKSGLSGAGKTPSDRTHFSENHGSVAAYNAFHHRHTPEMEQMLGRGLTFLPHLVPLDRGLLSTTYTRVGRGVSARDVERAFEAAYAGEPFIRLRGGELPEIKHVVWSNFCDIGWSLHEETGRLIVVSALDNLVKGAAGSAIQNFNVAFGLDETSGLT